MCQQVPVDAVLISVCASVCARPSPVWVASQSGSPWLRSRVCERTREDTDVYVLLAFIRLNTLEKL